MSRLLLRLFALSLFASSLVFLDACNDPKTEPQCQTNRDCKTGEFCDRLKRCQKLAECQADTDCDAGKRCDKGSCVLSGTETSLPDTDPKEAAPEGNAACGGRTSCTDFSQCGTNETCLNGCCLPACDAQGQCPTGLFCRSDIKQCVPCVTDDHCGASTLCDPKANCTTSLIKRCVQNQCADAPCECSLGQTCNAANGLCESGKQCPGGVPPDPQGNCPKPCATTQCPAGETPDAANNCVCIKRKQWCETCTANAECGTTGLCVADDKGNKYCAEDCSTSSSCSDPSYNCFFDGTNKFCKPTLGYCPCLGVSCTPGQKCCPATGACQECCSQADCQAPKICHNVTYACVEDKCSGVSCSSGQQCDPATGQCVGGSGACGTCAAGTCCNATTRQCTASACGSANCNPPCQAGTSCCDFGGQSQCLPQCPTGSTCKKDSDCQSGQICCNLMGLMQSCVDGKDPLMVALCGGGSGSCQSDNDCTGGQKCCAPLLPIGGKSCKASCTSFP